MSKTSITECSVRDCGGSHEAKGLCVKHYKRLLRYGNPDTTYKIHYTSVLDKIFASIAIPHDYENDCWVWVKNLTSGGYGDLQWQGRATNAHRALYKILVNDDINDLVVDHLCRNRACVNPNHLEAVTSRENTIRGFESRRQERYYISTS